MNQKFALGVILIVVGLVGLISVFSMRIMFTGSMGRMMHGWDGMTGPQDVTGETGITPQGSVTSKAISMDQAIGIARLYLSSLNNPDLAIDEIMEFDQNFYVACYEKSTGIGAFEMLIDRYTGRIYPEPGPNMMWNTKYGGMMGNMGGMGGMMGGPQQGYRGEMTIAEDQAEKYAQDWLDAYLPGATVEEPNRFYGYYTIDIEKDGRTFGMLSVNGYNGQVWFHSWHGSFIEMKELRED